MFAKTKAPGWIVDSVSISLSTMISIFAVMAYFFNEMQLIGILSNVIILPIFSVLFSLIFILSILSLMLPVISYSLILVNPLFEWMNWIIIFISNLTTSMPIIKFNYLSILLWFTFIVFAGRYNLKRGLIKAVMSTSILAIISVQLLAIA